MELVAEPGNESNSESETEPCLEPHLEPEDLSHLPVIELAPLSKYRVVPGCQCPNEKEGWHNLSREAVEDGASRGCPVCIFEYNQFVIFDGVFDGGQYHFETLHCEGHPLIFVVMGRNFPNVEYYTVGGILLEVCLSSPVTTNSEAPNWTTPEAGMGNFHGTKVHLPRCFTTYPVGSDIMDKASTTQSWLSNCLGSHASCKAKQPSRLPARVLDISSTNVRLLETNNRHGEYACLSHCWGPSSDSRILRTLTANLAMFYTNIPWTVLPRTFRDAITFARGVGIKHLWIDSLCIIQDDAEDWDREAAKMADIYTNCVLSIAAMTSDHADGGLFCKQDSVFREIVVAYITDPDGKKTPIYARWSEQHNLDAQPSLFPLSVRGWVLQERLLAPRTVYFLGSEIGWECRESTQCECGEGLNGLSAKENFWSQRNIVGKANHGTWHAVVIDYTQLDLTFGKDKLSALSGLATRWPSISGDEYLAGLWRRSVFEDLLWTTLGGATKRACPWRAPSWSWASVDCAKILYSWTSYKSHQIDLVSVRCEPAGLDPKGAVSSGRLVLRGKLMDGMLSDDLDTYPHKGAIQFPVQNTSITPKYFADTLWWEPGDDFIASGTVVKVFMLSMGLEHDLHIGVFCLVLKASDLEEGAYERIGLLKYVTEDVCPGLGAFSWQDLKIALHPNSDHEHTDPEKREDIRAVFSASVNAELARNWQVPTVEVTIL